MPESRPDGQDSGDADVRRGDESPPATPRWVYAFAIIAIILVLAFIISHLAGGGFRGH